MKRGIALFLVLAVLTSSATAVHAARKQRDIRMEVEWAQLEGSSYWTQVHMSANPAEMIGFAAYFPNVPPSSIDFELGPDGHDSLYKADPSYWMSARGFYISLPDSTMALMGTFWFHQNCLPGPTVKIGSRTITITNTTQISLYIQEGRRWKEIEAGESLNLRAVKGKRSQDTMNIVELKTARSVDAPTCADVRWRAQ